MKKSKYLKLNKSNIIKKNNNSNEKNIHFGFAILKNFLAFEVIISHCFNRGLMSKIKNKFILLILTKRRTHVPSFFILSFYFNHNTLVSNDWKKKINRFARLLIPYIGWPIIIFIESNNSKYYKKYEHLSSYKILIYQLLTGEGQRLFHFWYLLDLIATTLLFILIILIFRKRYLLVFHLIIIFSYYLQYSEYYKKMIAPFYSKNAYSRENELIPYAVTGFTLASVKFFKLLENYKFNTFVLSILIYHLVRNKTIFADSYGVVYHGIHLNVLSICLVTFFSLFPLNFIKNKYLFKLLKIITNHSGGIFYLHQMVQFYFKDYFIEIKNATFNGLIIIYLISYIISVLGTAIFYKTILKNLFS